jgi:predicted RNA-binding protein with PUA-like domain
MNIKPLYKNKRLNMNYWLVKSEPDECGINDFADTPNKSIQWDGVRNYQARNFLRQMQVDDRVVLYHSSCKTVGAAGIIKVTKTDYPDPEQFNLKSDYYDPKSTQDAPRWSTVDFVFVEQFAHIVPLATLKQHSELHNCMLVTRNRLSVLPLTPSEFAIIIDLAN